MALCNQTVTNFLHLLPASIPPFPTSESTGRLGMDIYSVLLGILFYTHIFIL